MTPLPPTFHRASRILTLALARNLAIACQAVSGPIHANKLPAAKAEGEQLCYTPNRQNTPYSEILKTASDTPSELIAYGDDALQFGELWLPHDAHARTNRPPLVILVHGGCWLNAYDIQHTHALSTALSRSGYAVWSLEYRRTGDAGGGWPGSLEDVIQGSEFAFNNLADRVDTERVVLIGHSAGGHLALLASSTTNLKQQLTGVIGLAAITDPALYSAGQGSCEKATIGFMGGTADEHPAAYAQATVQPHNLPRNSVLLMGSADPIVPQNQLPILGPDETHVRSVNISGAGHFDFIDPYSWAFSEILKSLAKLLPVTPLEPSTDEHTHHD